MYAIASRSAASDSNGSHHRCTLAQSQSRKKPSKAVFSYTPQEQESICWVLESYRRRGYAIILFMLETGLRAGEALALRWDDVNFEGKRLHVHYYTSVDAGTQAQFLQDAVAANADLLLVSLADAASAAEFSQTLSAAEIPVLYFNAEPILKFKSKFIVLRSDITQPKPKMQSE